MRKAIIISAVFFVFSVGSGFAAPINNLVNGQTAIGFVEDDLYIEHKLNENVTLGIEEDSFYGQYNLNTNLRAIVGSRDYHSHSSFYAGAAINAPVAPKLDGYASFVGSDKFQELQVGANFNVASNLDININYRSFMPNHGSDDNRTAIGATFKF